MSTPSPFPEEEPRWPQEDEDPLTPARGVGAAIVITLVFAFILFVILYLITALPQFD